MRILLFKNQKAKGAKEMRPQKSKRNRQFENDQKWSKYYLSDISCAYCQYFRGKKRGCPFGECAYEEEKLEAITSGRMVRTKVRT